MITNSFPQLASMYATVASVSFSVAYASSNIFMGNAAKNWNKKLMLVAGIVGLSSSSLFAGMTNSLAVFAFCRFFFGVCASAINAPIYQLIADNFPPDQR